MSQSSDLRRWRAEASCARRRERLEEIGNFGDVGEVEQLRQMGEVEAWALLVVGEMEGENEKGWFSLEDVGSPSLAFDVRLKYSPSGELMSQHRVVLGGVSYAMGMHPSC